ncbi:hypothetical protein NDU88_008814 [Pleurodeles waltl]|uniref:Uncharacterized protein n=1 Tax=Pleurodeles waltl TaxID=8319 RepID=A0AAV7QR22_PLEWA|nr:hypothetical protein NDU88_008814 [Pleurodeles waltl]
MHQQPPLDPTQHGGQQAALAPRPALAYAPAGAHGPIKLPTRPAGAEQQGVGQIGNSGCCQVPSPQSRGQGNKGSKGPHPTLASGRRSHRRCRGLRAPRAPRAKPGPATEGRTGQLSPRHPASTPSQPAASLSLLLHRSRGIKRQKADLHDSSI